jgi:hypothetical protein
MLFQKYTKTEIKNNKKDEEQNTQRKIYSFFQPLFCQRSSAHLQKANANPNAYFAKELIFPTLAIQIKHK